MTAVVRVPCIYGGHYWVAQADLDNPKRVLLPLYSRDGRLWEETVRGKRALREHSAMHLHRENIGPVKDGEA